jgi:aminodeoxyfutalosine synthase
MALSTLAHRALERAGLAAIRDKVLSNERLTDADALCLLESKDFAALGALASHVREARHGDLAFYNGIPQLHPDVCVASDRFCSFARP